MIFKEFKMLISSLSKKEQKWAYFFYFLDKTNLWKIRELVLKALVIVLIVLLAPFHFFGILTKYIFELIYDTNFYSKFWIFRKKRKEILKKLRKAKNNFK